MPFFPPGIKISTTRKNKHIKVVTQNGSNRCYPHQHLTAVTLHEIRNAVAIHVKCSVNIIGDYHLESCRNKRDSQALQI